MSVNHLNQQQLACRWAVSESTLERWRSVGIGPVFLKLGGRIVYRLDDVEAYEEKSQHRCTDEYRTGGVA